jgi:flagellar biosynthesis chaperone FliJ
MVSLFWNFKFSIYKLLKDMPKSKKEDKEVKKLDSVQEYTKRKYTEEVQCYEKMISKLEKSIASHNDSLKDKEKALDVAKKELLELNKLSLLIL